MNTNYVDGKLTVKFSVRPNGYNSVSSAVAECVKLANAKLEHEKEKLITVESVRAYALEHAHGATASDLTTASSRTQHIAAIVSKLTDSDRVTFVRQYIGSLTFSLDIPVDVQYLDWILYRLESGLAVGAQDYVRELMAIGKSNAEITDALNRVDWNARMPKPAGADVQTQRARIERNVKADVLREMEEGVRNGLSGDALLEVLKAKFA